MALLLQKDVWALILSFAWDKSAKDASGVASEGRKLFRLCLVCKMFRRAVLSETLWLSSHSPLMHVRSVLFRIFPSGLPFQSQLLRWSQNSSVFASARLECRFDVKEVAALFFSRRNFRDSSLFVPEILSVPHHVSRVCALCNERLVCYLDVAGHLCFFSLVTHEVVQRYAVDFDPNILFLFNLAGDKIVVCVFGRHLRLVGVAASEDMSNGTHNLFRFSDSVKANALMPFDMVSVGQYSMVWVRRITGEVIDVSLESFVVTTISMPVYAPGPNHVVVSTAAVLWNGAIASVCTLKVQKESTFSLDPHGGFILDLAASPLATVVSGRVRCSGIRLDLCMEKWILSYDLLVNVLELSATPRLLIDGNLLFSWVHDHWNAEPYFLDAGNGWLTLTPLTTLFEMSAVDDVLKHIYPSVIHCEVQRSDESKLVMWTLNQDLYNDLIVQVVDPTFLGALNDLVLVGKMVVPRSYRAREVYKSARFVLSLSLFVLALAPICSFSSFAWILAAFFIFSLLSWTFKCPDHAGWLLGVCMIALDVYNGQPMNRCTATTCGMLPLPRHRFVFLSALAWFRGYLLGSSSVAFSSTVSSESAFTKWIISSGYFAIFGKVIQWLWYRIETDDDPSERLLAIILYVVAVGGVRDRPGELMVVACVGHVILATITTAMLRKRFVRHSFAMAFVASVAFVAVLVLALVVCVLFLPSRPRDDGDGVGRLIAMLIKSIPELLPRNWKQGVALFLVSDCVTIASRKVASLSVLLSFVLVGVPVALQWFL